MQNIHEIHNLNKAKSYSKLVHTETHTMLQWYLYKQNIPLDCGRDRNDEHKHVSRGEGGFITSTDTTVALICRKL